MSDFRVYDDALSSTEVSDVFSAGPNPSPLALTMFTHVADLTWESIGGASEYTITFKIDGGSEIVHTTTEELSHSVYNLIQGSSYEFNLYTDLDVVTPIDTMTDSPLVVNAVNVDSLLTRLSNDISLLNSTSIDDIEEFIPSSLTTGETVNTSLGNAIFVANSDTVTLTDPNGSVLTPFLASSGSGQTVTINLPDTSSALVEYDETNEEIVFETTNYSVNEHFVVGDLKVIIKEI